MAVKRIFTDKELSALPLSLQKNYANFCILPISQLVSATWNYKEEDKALSQKLHANLSKNGVVENIQVRKVGAKKYEVINGNHRLVELKKLGYKYVVCYNHGNISIAQAKKLAVLTNETYFLPIKSKLNDLIKQMAVHSTVEELATVLPYQVKDIEQVIGTTVSTTSPQNPLDIFQNKNSIIDDVDDSNNNSVYQDTQEQLCDVVISIGKQIKYQVSGYAYQSFILSIKARHSYMYNDVLNILKGLLGFTNTQHHEV